MDAAVLSTKLQVPRLRAERVSRPQLLDRLDAGLDGKLTLVAAPAGFGKTTLVAEWLAGLDRPSVWISLDERDSDPARFLTYLIRGLQQVEDEAGESTLAALHSGGLSANLLAGMPQLVNDIASIPEAFVLVLDDYHLVAGTSVHDILTYLVDHQPESMHLVIASRADPPLPLARLRARGQLQEVRQTDLLFSAAEAEQVFERSLGPTLNPDQIAALTERTEGWIAGLQMACLALHGLGAEPGVPRRGAADFVRTFGGTHRHVADYLVEEVLARQPVAVRTFLLRTSILERMCGDLCDALGGEAEARPGDSERRTGQQMLEDLERANLFVSPLDDRRRWYRYHRLFADLLQMRLRHSPEARTTGPDSGELDESAVLHRRAAAWFESQDMLPEAIRHALHADDDEHAAGLIERATPQAWRQGELGTAMGWLEALPEEERRRRPVLAIYLATLCLLRAESFGRIEALIREAQQADLQRAHAGEIALLSAMLAMYQGQIPAALALAEKAAAEVAEASIFRGLATRVLSALRLMAGDLESAERLLERDLAASELAGDRLGWSASLRRLGSLAFLRGELTRAQANYERALELSRDSSGRLWPVAGRIVIHLAELALERNELDQADALRRQAAELLSRFLPGWDSETYVLLARLEHASRREAEARAAMQAAVERARLTDTSMDDAYLEILAARLAIWQGDLTGAERWAERWPSSPGPGGASASSDLEGILRSQMFREIGRTTLARVHLARQAPERALELLNPPLESEPASPWANRVELLALRALAHQARGAAAEARQDLDRAVRLAEPQGFVRTFLEEGEPMKRLLMELVAQDPAAQYARILLGSFERATDARPAAPKPSADSEAAGLAWVEPLTDREIEVLRALQSSLTTPEIAAELGIAPSTVRTFVKNVYGKLGVHRRIEAVERGREIGLLKTG